MLKENDNIKYNPAPNNYFMAHKMGDKAPKFSIGQRLKNKEDISIIKKKHYPGPSQYNQRESPHFR